MIFPSARLLLVLGALSAAVGVASAAALKIAPNDEEVLMRAPRQAEELGGPQARPVVISPCPSILYNIRFRPDGRRWSGLFSYIPDENTTGVVVEVELDKPVNFLGSPFGEVSSNDSITHVIKNDDYEADVDIDLKFRILVQYEVAEDPPRVRTIKFNGKLICPDDGGEPPFTSDVAAPTFSPPSTTTRPPSTTTRRPSTTTRRPSTTARPSTTTARPALPPIEGDIAVTVTTSVSSSTSTSSPREKLTEKVVTTSDPYEISGNFKIYSNTSLVLLLAARPPKPGSSEETKIETDELSMLIAQVFNNNSETDFASGPAVIQLLPMDKDREDGEDEPPFTSGTRQLPPLEGGNSRLDGVRGGRAQWTSPCDGVFTYLTDSIKSDSWYGVLTLTSMVDVRGIRLDFELDKPARVFGAWLGEATTMDKKHYTIWNPYADIDPDEVIVVRIFAKYDPSEFDPPRISSIRFNGRRICPV
ncbi:uncharacterized protein LOC124155874 isoform X2 [Ischnura elegans]|nr:uncharacterized protein LOC124155874 isoform X2 [Ischnura elegans]